MVGQVSAKQMSKKLSTKARESLKFDQIRSGRSQNHFYISYIYMYLYLMGIQYRRGMYRITTAMDRVHV